MAAATGRPRSSTRSRRPTPRIRVIRQPHNMGKGAAIRTAIEHMRGDIGLIQDADLEYDPADYPALIAPILEGKADAVFGSRFAVGVAAQGPAVLARRREPLPHLADQHPQRHQPDGHGDLLQGRPGRRPQADAAQERPLRHRAGADDASWRSGTSASTKCPISYHGRTVAEGKKIGWKDAVSAVWTLLKYRFIDDRFTTHDGYYVLQSMRRARGLNRWILDQFRDVPRQPRARGRLRHRQLHRAAAGSRAAGVPSTTIRSTSRWRTGVSAISRTSPRCMFDLADSAAYATARGRAHRHDRLPERARAHRAKTSRCLRAYYDLLAARRPRHHPGSRAPVALQPVRRGARPSAALHERRAALQTAARRLRGRQHGGVQSPRRARLVSEQAARAPRSQSAADAGVRVAAAGGEGDGAHEARSRA